MLKASRHMQALGKVCAADPKLLLATPYKVVAFDDAEAVNEAVRWWEDLTGTGGKGWS